MLSKFSVLFAEDEEITRNNIAEALSLFVGKVYTAEDGQEAYEIYLEKKPDIIIADIEMPKLNGLKLAEKIREDDKNTQIVLATAYTNTEYLIKAVELNLVKYLTKPVNATALKNALKNCEKNIIALDNPIKKISETCTYDLKSRILMIDGKEEKLTHYQRLFLEYLLKSGNRIVGYIELEHNIWQEEGMSSNALRSLVKNLRRKLPEGCIENISKLGYKIKTCDNS